MADAPRFTYDPQQFVGVADPELIYVGIKDREAFDRIALPLTDYGPNDQGHVLIKQLGSMRRGEVTVIFQHWLLSLTIEAMMADRVGRTSA